MLDLGPASVVREDAGLDVLGAAFEPLLSLLERLVVDLLQLGDLGLGDVLVLKELDGGSVVAVEDATIDDLEPSRADGIDYRAAVREELDVSDFEHCPIVGKPE